MFELLPPDFASPKSVKLCESHNHAVAQLEASRAETERAAETLRKINPFETDAADVEAMSAEIRRARYEALKTEIGLCQERLEILAALEIDRAAAQQAAAETLDQSRRTVRAGLAELGYETWLSNRNTTVKNELSILVDSASPCNAAARRLADVRDKSGALVAEVVETRRKLSELSEKLRKAVQDASAVLI